MSLLYVVEIVCPTVNNILFPQDEVITVCKEKDLNFVMSRTSSSITISLFVCYIPKIKTRI